MNAGASGGDILKKRSLGRVDQLKTSTAEMTAMSDIEPMIMPERLA